LLSAFFDNLLLQLNEQVAIPAKSTKLATYATRLKQINTYFLLYFTRAFWFSTDPLLRTHLLPQDQDGV
jgi:hypothetical protein